MDKRAEQLFEKLRNDTLTPQERAELESWYTHYASAQEPLRDPDIFRNRLAQMDSSFQFNKGARVKRIWPRIAAAASILLAITAGGYLIWHQQKPVQRLAQTQPVKNDALPGTNKATLTLSNGQKIVLDSVLTGSLARQGNALIKKSAGGAVVYTANNTIASSEPVYNTLTTKKGQQYPLVMADGTKAWLNAESSITYPVQFSGERKVTITGEVYFEVVHDPKHPFKVVANNQTIGDIGTHFNVNAYGDEPATVTTLAEGSVKITSGSNNHILKPGQQAVTPTATNDIIVRKADIESALAWRNGLFHFNKADLKTAMRQIARWYDLDVVYEGTIPKTYLDGDMYRDMKASQALDVLDYLNVKFRIEGNKLIIANK